MGTDFRPATFPASGKREVQAKGTRRGSAPAPEPATTTDATDAAKALADEHGLDLATVTGTGADGRITKDDVQQAIDAQAELDVEPSTEDDA